MAFHHPDEALANLMLLTALVPIRNQPRISRALQICLVNLPHLFHRQSVHVRVLFEFCGYTCAPRTFPLKYSILVDALPFRPTSAPLHKTLSPISEGLFVLMFERGL